MSRKLHGRVVVVTGAARGIGYAISERLLALGVKVIIADVDREALHAAAATLNPTHHQVTDVTDPAQFDELLEVTEAQVGPLYGLVNNAGIMPIGGFLAEPDSLTRRVVEIDTLGVMFGTKHALRRMVPRGEGHIINVASIFGEVAAPGTASYNGAKGAVVLFGDAVRAEYRRSGIKVSTVLPGPVNTGLATGVNAAQAVRIGRRKITVSALAEPKTIAAAVSRALESGRSHRRLYVPRTLTPAMIAVRAVPAIVKDAAFNLPGVPLDRLLHPDIQARESYQRRMEKS